MHQPKNRKAYLLREHSLREGRACSPVFVVVVAVRKTHLKATRRFMKKIDASSRKQRTVPIATTLRQQRTRHRVVSIVPVCSYPPGATAATPAPPHPQNHTRCGKETTWRDMVLPSILLLVRTSAQDCCCGSSKVSLCFQLRVFWAAVLLCTILEVQWLLNKEGYRICIICKYEYTFVRYLYLLLTVQS